MPEPKSKKVKDLIKERQKDNPDTKLPKIPSAQMWKDLSEDERQEIKDLLKIEGLNPDEVLTAHWPKTPVINPLVWRKR